MKRVCFVEAEERMRATVASHVLDVLRASVEGGRCCRRTARGVRIIFPRRHPPRLVTVEVLLKARHHAVAVFRVVEYVEAKTELF